MVLAAGLLMPAAGQVYWKDAKPISANPALREGTGHETQPRLAYDGGGSYLAIWTNSSNIFCGKSTDGGITWGKSVKITDNETMPNPFTISVAHTGSSWVAQWYTKRASGILFQTVMDTFFSRSVDGVNWSSPLMVNSETVQTATADSAASSDGTIITLNGNTYSRSTDGGISWTTGSLLGESPTNPHTTTIATNGTGKWYASADALFYVSTDNGLTWTRKTMPADFSRAKAMAAAGDTVVAAGDV